MTTAVGCCARGVVATQLRDLLERGRATRARERAVVVVHKADVAREAILESERRRAHRARKRTLVKMDSLLVLKREQNRSTKRVETEMSELFACTHFFYGRKNSKKNLPCSSCRALQIASRTGRSRTGAAPRARYERVYANPRFVRNNARSASTGCVAHAVSRRC